ncbi:ankyrin repeat protein [Edaphobacter aggregans]|uniref:Ankyrin repeat protein n=1 Tax=Edaphobacter aggregans TaxID=570835 RepID=A0A3R9QCF2_9BACT|nr:DUF6438 domain-containing protein [Edaphobacter aggregans]RSL17878.1 ankyrin repeat protein [Edaphobacter aggregans]
MMRYPKSLSLAATFLLFSSLLHAQQPKTLTPSETDLWNHRLGPERAIHLTAAESADLQRHLGGHEYLEYEIVVSENGRVESATLLPNAQLDSLKPHTEEGQGIELSHIFKPWLQDGRPIKVSIHDYVSLYPPEQWGEPSILFPEVTELSSVKISLTRTPCYGTCPGYAVTISGDGVIHYTGGHMVLIPGDHIAHIKPDAVRELLQSFRKADLFSAKDEYRGNWTDNPTQTITLVIGTRHKTVIDYVGTDAGLPLAIRNLEEQIDEVADTKRWVKFDSNTLPSLLEEKWPFKSSSEQNLALYSSAITSRNTALIHQYVASAAPIVAPVAGTASPVCVVSSVGDVSLVKSMTEYTKTFPPRVLNECLSSSARSGNLTLLQLWLDHGADPRAKPEKIKGDWISDVGPLPNALISGNADVVRKLLDYKVDVHANVQENEPLLFWALERNQSKDEGQQIAEIITMLAEAGADVNVRGNMNETPIFAANYHPEAIKALLAAGADIEARDRNGNTPLIRNAFMEKVVRELLADGADPAAVAKNGDTALKNAHQYSCPACATLIEEALEKRVASLPR